MEGIKMESKKQLLEAVSKSESDRREYLNALFKYVPDAIVKTISCKKIKKGEYIIHEGTSCDMVYIILSGTIVGMDYQKQGRA